MDRITQFSGLRSRTIEQACIVRGEEDEEEEVGKNSYEIESESHLAAVYGSR